MVQQLLQALHALPDWNALCAALRKVADGHAEDQLLAIAADGRVDEMEERQFVELTEELDDVIAAALTLRYAEGGVRAWS